MAHKDSYYTTRENSLKFNFCLKTFSEKNAHVIHYLLINFRVVVGHVNMKAKILLDSHFDSSPYLKDISITCLNIKKHFYKIIFAESTSKSTWFLFPPPI